jgi:hypothetical protein
MKMPSLSWDRRRAAHLYRRAGFGGTPEELDLAVSLGREGAVAYLVDYESISTADLDAYVDLYSYGLASYSESSNPLSWWYLRMQYTPRPLEEKMTLFWHNHFATANRKVLQSYLMYQQNQVFRTLGKGHFGDLLLAVARDPAMLLWLDGASNAKGSPNENFAREVMELFTMGRGHYTQTDVTEAARALTGWTVDSNENDNRFLFNPDFHDDGLKVFLGNQGYFKGEDIVSILAARPETAAFITSKLARFFLGHDPRPALARRLQDVYVATAGNIREIVREVLLSDDFDETADRADMIKSPAELVIGAYRGLGLYVNDEGYRLDWAPNMGQALFEPPDVGGWKGGRAWINTAAYLVRVSFVFDLMATPSPWADTFRWDFSRFFDGTNFSTADELIDFLVDRLNVIEPSEVLRKALRAAAGEPFNSNGDKRGVIYVLMSSPEYQLQ